MLGSQVVSVRLVPFACPRERASRLVIATLVGGAILLIALWNPIAQPGPVLCGARLAFGIPCPLCGGTRGAALCLRGHPLEATVYNPLSLPALLFAIGLASRSAYEYASGKRIVVDRPPWTSRAVRWTLVLALLATWVYLLTYRVEDDFPSSLLGARADGMANGTIEPSATEEGAMLREEQIDIRRKRAAEEGLRDPEPRPQPRLQRLSGHQPRAATASTASRIRGFDIGDNTCDCPDFRTNTLGTCKHVEAVLAALRDEAPPQLRARKAAVTHPEIYLQYGEQLRIGIHLPARYSDMLRTLNETFFDLKGLWKGDERLRAAHRDGRAGARSR